MNETHVPPSRIRLLSELLIRNRYLLLLVVIVVTALAAIPASRLEFDQSIESLYALDDPYLIDYRESKSLFGGDEFVMVAYTDEELLTDEGLERVREFSRLLSETPGVRKESTQDLANTLAPPQLPWYLRWLLKKQALIDLSRSVLIGDDNQTTAVILRLQPEDPAVPRGRTFAEIRKAAEAHSPRAYVVGEPVQVHDMFRYVEEDGTLLFRVSLALLAGVIFILFRNLRWVVLPLAVVVVAIVWTQALLVLSGMRLSMVSSMLNSLLTIIGVATVMHVTLHFREHRRTLGRIEALERTLTELAPPIFWTCGTTAVGFAALLSSGITPVYSFGTMMALGTLMVLVATATLLPGGILAGRIAIDPAMAPAERQLAGMLGRISGSVQKRPRFIVFGVLALFGFALAGFGRLEIETDFSKNFRESSDIVKSLNFVETRLGGAGTWEVNFPAPKVLDPDYLNRVRRLATALRKIEIDGERPLTKVIALTDVLDSAKGIADKPGTIRSKLEKIATIQPEYEPSLYNPGHGRMRLMLRARERQPSQKKLQLMDDVQQMAVEEFEEAKTTGLFVMLAHLIDSLLRDQLVSFALAAVGIGGMMSIAFGSLRIGLISLVPNLLPIVLLVGMMGWVGLPINIGTAMIASVSMGLTVDASIHYISGYRNARRRGLTFDDALRATHEGVGRALVFSTLALIVGFSVLTLSNFIPLVYFGILVSVAMLGGLIGNLVLLPLLLKWAERAWG